MLSNAGPGNNLTPRSRRGEEEVLFVSKIIKLKQYGTGTETDIQTNGTEQRAQKKIHDQLIPDEDAKNTQGDRIVSLTNCVGKTGYPHAKL